MNLIEQLGEKESLAAFVVNGFGGYEKAKAVLNNPSSAFLHNTEALRQRLLEYRRANNIFEVGDFVLPISSEFSNEVLELTEDYVSFDFKYKSRNGGFGYIVKSFMPTRWRHATDKEIKAGHRL